MNYYDCSLLCNIFPSDHSTHGLFPLMTFVINYSPSTSITFVCRLAIFSQTPIVAFTVERDLMICQIFDGGSRKKGNPQEHCRHTIMRMEI